MVGSHRIDDTVRTDFIGMVIVKLKARVAVTGNNKGRNAEIAFAHIAERHQKGRNNGGNDDVLDGLHIDTASLEHAA